MHVHKHAADVLKLDFDFPKKFCLKKEREWKSENWVGGAFENSLLLPTSSILPTYVQKPALQGFSYFYSIKQFAAGADQIFRSSDWGRFT
jgi:hypothetical protein